MIIQLQPAQFPLAGFWFEHKIAARQDEGIRAALAALTDKYIDIVDMMYEDQLEDDPEMAELERALGILTAQTKVHDLHWLRETFEGCDFDNFCLAIACYVYPDKEWLILEDHWRAVVTDPQRSLVFDLKNGLRLSGGASLISVRDKIYQGSTKQFEEVNALDEEASARLQNALHISQKILRDHEIDPKKS